MTVYDIQWITIPNGRYNEHHNHVHHIASTASINKLSLKNNELIDMKYNRWWHLKSARTMNSISEAKIQPPNTCHIIGQILRAISPGSRSLSVLLDNDEWFMVLVYVL